MPSRPIHQILSDRPFVGVSADTPVREVVRQMNALQRSAALVTSTACSPASSPSAMPPSACWPPAWTPTPRGGCGDDAQPGDADRGPPLWSRPAPDVRERRAPRADRRRQPPPARCRHRARDALQLDALTFGAELVRREEITVIL